MDLLTENQLKKISELAKPLLDFIDNCYPTKENEKLILSMTIELKETITLLNANKNGEKTDIKIELPKIK